MLSRSQNQGKKFFEWNPNDLFHSTWLISIKTTFELDEGKYFHVMKKYFYFIKTLFASI